MDIALCIVAIGVLACLFLSLAKAVIDLTRKAGELQVELARVTYERDQYKLEAYLAHELLSRELLGDVDQKESK